MRVVVTWLTRIMPCAHSVETPREAHTLCGFRAPSRAAGHVEPLHESHVIRRSSSRRRHAMRAGRSRPNTRYLACRIAVFSATRGRWSQSKAIAPAGVPAQCFRTRWSDAPKTVPTADRGTQ